MKASVSETDQLLSIKRDDLEMTCKAFREEKENK